MVAEKNCLHFWGQIATQVSKYVAGLILAPESRFRGIRWGNLHHFFEIFPFRLVQGEREGVRNENLSMVPQMLAFAEGTK